MREFNDSVAKTPGSKEIVKSYAALVYAKHAVPLGSLTHWMYPGPFGPGRVPRANVAKVAGSTSPKQRGR